MITGTIWVKNCHSAAKMRDLYNFLFIFYTTSFPFLLYLCPKLTIFSFTYKNTIYC